MKSENEFDVQDFEEMKTFLKEKGLIQMPRNQFFSKKVMNSILTHHKVTAYKSRFNIYVKIALFLTLCLFPALTEAI
jgi:hypothetical protein